MSRNPISRDADALMRAVNAVAEPPSTRRVELALQRLLAETEPPVAAAAGPRRLALAGGLLVAGVAAGFAVINLLPASSANSGVGAAWAKNVIARSAGMAAGVGDGILHIDMRVTETSAARSDNVRYRVKSWAQLGAPRAIWETIVSRSNATTTTVVGDHVESYDSATNTLAGAAKQIGAGGCVLAHLRDTLAASPERRRAASIVWGTGIAAAACFAIGWGVDGGQIFAHWEGGSDHTHTQRPRTAAQLAAGTRARVRSVRCGRARVGDLLRDAVRDRRARRVARSTRA